MLSLTMSIQNAVYHQKMNQLLAILQNNYLKHINDIYSLDQHTHIDDHAQAYLDQAKDLVHQYRVCHGKIKRNYSVQTTTIWPYQTNADGECLEYLEEQLTEIDCSLQDAIKSCRKKIFKRYPKLPRVHSW